MMYGKVTTNTTGEKVMKGHDFRTALAKIAPEYVVEQDNTGQVVIYTGLYNDGNDNYLPYEEEGGE